jgi:hypothetical protein
MVDKISQNEGNRGQGVNIRTNLKTACNKVRFSVRKYQDMGDRREEELGPKWVEKEERVNRDKRPGIKATSPEEALKKIRRSV